MLESISIKNFKGIPELSMNLAPFTLISGANNVGKTSVLEAVFLMYNHGDSNLFQKLINLRNTTLVTSSIDTRDVWEYLFYNYEVKKALSISAIRNKNKEAVSLIRDDEWDSVINLADYINSTGDNSIVEYSYPLKLSFVYDNTEFNTHTTLSLSSSKSVKILSKRESSSNVIIPASSAIFTSDKILSAVEMTNSVGELIRNKQIPSLVEILKNLDSRINDVVLGEKQRIYLDVGLDEMIPLSSMGSGISNIINWSTIILRNKADILLIDEIESGIHYSSMKSVIEALGNVGKKYNCQIIATTHSLDSVKAFSAFNEKNTDRGVFVRLERDKKTSGIAAKEIDNDSLRRMLNSEWEVR
jgi:AAA15 family ATPase/GTPase